MGVTPIRRSGRHRVPAKKYTGDVFEALDIEVGSDPDDNARISKDDVDSKDDFDFPGNEALQGTDENDEDDSDASASSNGTAFHVRRELSIDASLARASNEALVSPQLQCQIGSKPRRRTQVALKPGGTRSKGLIHNVKLDDGQSRIQLLAGPDVNDILHIARSRDEWANDPTLPRKAQMCHSISHTEVKRMMEAKSGWDWYYDDGGQELFCKTQKLMKMSAHAGREYISFLKTEAHQLVMGPYGQQKMFSLPSLRSLSLNEAPSPNNAPQGNGLPEVGCDHRRLGWMLNVGARVRCLDWAPNQEGDIQYLAVAPAGTDAHVKNKFTNRAPAFTPSSPTPSCIQLWSLPSSKVMEEPVSSYVSRSPRLETVFCVEWGEIKQLKWCPMPRASRVDEMEAESPIGLIAGISGDGYARVFDVFQVKDLGAGETRYVKLDSAAFAVRPEGTVCTCLAWLSPTDLAVGHANGYLTIHDICPRVRPRATSTGERRRIASNASRAQSPSDPYAARSTFETKSQIQPHKPWLSISIHSTLVFSLTPAYPAHPSLLLSCSLSGYSRLTSLVNPTVDFALTRRSNTPTSNLIYHDGLKGAVAPDEGGELLRLHGLRCWSSGVGFARLSSSSGMGVGCMDAGKVHSSIAWGGVDGRVIVTNPMRRILNKRDGAFQQTVFRHDWRPLTPSEDSLAAKNDVGGRRGISRITDGYRVEIARVDVKAKGAGTNGCGAAATIYEEETSVTAVSWNPNLCAGSWLAVGWGSGLVRVEDVGV